MNKISLTKVPKRGMIGFTLIEIMVVIAIIAILAAVGYPAYVGQQQKGRRADGHTALISARANIENQLAVLNTYDYTKASIPTSSQSGFYNLSIKAGTGNGFELTATATGVQTRDTACATMTLTSEGTKAPANCW